MKMIKLTLIDEETGSKQQAFFNPETFARIVRNTEERWTEIYFNGADFAYVTQTPKAIFKLIAEAQEMSALDAGLYDTTYGAMMADFDRMDDDHRAFAEYDKLVAAQQASDMSGFLSEVRAGVIDSIRGLRVTSRSQHPNGRCSVTLAGPSHGLRNIHVGDDVDILPGRIELVTTNDLKLLIEFHEADDHLQTDAAEMSRLVDLGWVVVIHNGIVLDAAEAAAFDNENDTAFLGMTKAGFAMLDQIKPGPEEAAFARLKAREVA